MIAKLHGKIDELKPTEIILDVNGVGYHLNIPFSTYEKIKNADKIKLHVFTHHKEDQFKLFGFFDEKEKNIFSILLNINGIGPSMALSILSGISINMLIEAVKSENTGLLTKIPGIGKAKAEKLIFELRRKLKKLEKFTDKTTAKPSIKYDAVDALVSLGFDEIKATKCIDDVLKQNPDSPLETIIKEALKLF